jgi:hypothetical protein
MGYEFAAGVLAGEELLRHRHTGIAGGHAGNVARRRDRAGALLRFRVLLQCRVLQCRLLQRDLLERPDATLGERRQVMVFLERAEAS